MTAEEIVERLQQVCQTKWIRWDLYDCPVCGCPIGYVFDEGQAYFDTTCGCTIEHNVLEPRSWEDVLNTVSQNMGKDIVNDLIYYITEE